MNQEDFEKAIKEISETAIKLMAENVALKNKCDKQDKQLKNASTLVRSRTYTIYDKKGNKESTKVEIADKKLEELMDYLEG